MRHGAFVYASVAFSWVLLGSACSHSAPGSAASSSTRAEATASMSEGTTTSSLAFGTGGYALYGDYVRPEFGLIKRPAIHGGSDEWFVTFPEPGAWRGVVVIGYAGRKLKEPGHAYRYTANRGGTLRLGAETQLPEKSPMVRGAFSCKRGDALYSWMRSADYTLLRLSPIRDSCAVRKRILTADWSFID